VCSFLKSSVQFLVKQNRDTPTECASHIFVEGDARYGGASPFYLISTKKKAHRLFSTGVLLAPAHSVPVGTHTHMYVYQWAPYEHGARSTEWSTSCMKSSKHIDCRGFKSLWACVLVDEVGLNL
jgi:hypothetical protein